MPNQWNQWDDTLAEQGDACPESWGLFSALDHHEALFAEEERAVLAEAEKHHHRVLTEIGGES